MTVAGGDQGVGRLRVLHGVEAYGGGLLEAVRLMATVADAAGNDVLIAYGRRPETPPRPQDLLPPGVQLRELPWGRRTPGAQLRALRGLRRLIREFRPDVVHLHSSFAGVIGGLAAAGTGTPVVFTPHAFASSQPNRPRRARVAYRAGERLAVRLATVVGTVSESEARVARDEIGARRVEVVANGIAELDDPPPAAAVAHARPRVVASGRMVAQRRPRECARILASLRDICDVAWIGGGREDDAWARRARAALESAGVPLTGWLEREDALAALGHATAYLHWTSWDGQPLSVLEAMARDVVVVASDIEPNREVLGTSQVCRTEEEAAALLRRVVTEPDLAERMRGDQRARRGRYGARRMGQEWLDVYRRLLKAQRT